MPVYSMIPTLGGGAARRPRAEDAKSIGRGYMFGVMFVSMAISGIAAWSWSAGWYCWFLLVEAIIAAALYAAPAAVYRRLE